MSNTPYWSWVSAERLCFEYLNKELGTIEGVNGFKPEDYPRTATLSSECNNWMFEMSGGESPFIRSPVERGNASMLWMLATFTGRFTERDVAQRVAMAVWSILPAGETTDNKLTGIVEVQPTAYPSVTPDTVELANDLEKGGEQRIWVVKIPCHVVFEYLPQIT